ncbi:glycosyltransferase [Sphaerisporangium album]|uniref:Glycosyltransferase n=1 Tax=Sphaerisporangium album TaxID=509200 RepID=A0A367FS44_9ACTN|nr:glycosyltransferase [Sphaerisporangium album]RCG33246.1 glycosyltransferase [Sphaerisporangium album]
MATAPASTMLLVTHGTDGDVLPFVRLGQELRAGGHPVTLLTHAHYRERAARAGLDFVAIDSQAQFERTLSDTPDLLDGLGWPEFYERNGLYEQMVLEFRALAERHRPGETVLVGRHTSALSVLFAAEALGAPAAWVAVAPIQVMATRAAMHAYRHLLADGLTRVRAEVGLGPVSGWDDRSAAPRLELGLWPGWFDRAGARSPAHVRLTGFPLPDDEDQALPPEAAAVLDGPVRPVLVTGGTGRMLHREFYDAAVEGARLSGRPVLLVVRHHDLVPDPLPPGVSWHPRLSFRAVMPRVAAIVHHGGIGTLSRALLAGTPQVILAHGVDRPDNAERLERHGLASWLPARRWTPEEVRALLARALERGTVLPPQDRTPAGGLGAAASLIAALPDEPAAESPADGIRRRLDHLSAEQRRMIADRLRGRLARQGP